VAESKQDEAVEEEVLLPPVVRPIIGPGGTAFGCVQIVGCVCPYGIPSLYQGTPVPPE
jgi:hypothetical protein